MGNDGKFYNVYADWTPSVPGTALLIGVIAVVSVWTRCIFLSKRLPLPPGPKPLPLLGNLFNMPRSREYEIYTEWREKYGDIVHMEVLGKHIIIINSVDVANDLLERRSAIYSDRPYMPMIHDPDLMDLDWSFAMKRYSSSWKRYRRLFAQHINSPTVKASYSSRQVSSTHTLLRSLLRSPAELDVSIHHMIGNVLLGMVYGFDVQPKNDPHVQFAEQFATKVALGMNPTKFLVNIIPWMKYIPSWFPGNKFKGYAKEAREINEKLARVPFETYRRWLAVGKASACFVGDALGDLGEMSDSGLLYDITKIAASIYGAGSDTTVIPLKSCILALVLNPDVQHRAHKELDTVLGSPDNISFRLPSFDDRPHLPYIDALLKESLRWIPVTGTGLPHATTEEDEYRGYRIPKESIILTNVWAMLRDETVYSDPFTFRPERFLVSVDKNPEADPATRGPFGFGRRVCPGQEVAYTSLWMSIASLLAVFNFAPPKDSEGKNVDISYATIPVAEGPVLLHPPPYTCSISPRSQHTKARILETEYQ
ncbi:cytochrome P450 [Hysterangium stoloniferum]|nr:cytochrome P450 [Hysterangium stoloniferum]